jgi:NAD(P) transhydrogenase subunit beta
VEHLEIFDESHSDDEDRFISIGPIERGRMPGHMDVLLAEAEIPYTDLIEMDEINPEMPQCDVALRVEEAVGAR